MPLWGRRAADGGRDKNPECKRMSILLCAYGVHSRFGSVIIVIKLIDTNPEYIIVDNISMIPYR